MFLHTFRVVPALKKYGELYMLSSELLANTNKYKISPQELNSYRLMCI